jgi:hypothetical protein
MPVQETSYAAHRQIRKCAPEMRRRIMEALRASTSGLTDEQICAAAGLAGNSERARRIELVESLDVVAAPWTRPTASGRQATVWMALGTP